VLIGLGAAGWLATTMRRAPSFRLEGRALAA
jgi:hypothetical protein